MLECGILDMKDDYDFKDEYYCPENKQNEKRKSKVDVSFLIFNFNLLYSVKQNFYL